MVLAWFPEAFTSGCTIECKSLAANGGKIRAYDVAYFMASVDDVEGEKGNKAFAESEKADFPILGDPSKETAKAYGILHPERGYAMRWTFYIDKNGTIAAIDKEVSPHLGRRRRGQAGRAEGGQGALTGGDATRLLRDREGLTASSSPIDCGHGHEPFAGGAVP